MKKAMFFMLLFVVVLFGGIFFFKYLVAREQKAYIKAHQVIITTVSAMQAPLKEWQPHLDATGSLRTVKGVNVTTELGGMIRDIYFIPGSYVQQGTVLVQLDIAPDVAKLHELQADAAIAKITFLRNQKQYQIGAISKETLERNEANYKATAALVEEQKATIAKKIVRAPFTGRLGISAVNPGQYITPGETIVTLETVDPIYADFFLPQQNLPSISVGQNAFIQMDAYPNKTFTGKITTINPIVTTSVRNVEVEATLPNKEGLLLPGMFVSVTLITGQPVKKITLPKLAISFNPYGSIVYVLTKTTQTKDGQPVWKTTQKFVKTGESRGNQVAVLSGIQVGDMVVTSGQLKLKNDSLVVINNNVAPSFDPDPKVPNR